MNKKPVIGITTYRKSGEQGYVFISVAEAYVSALLEAGALPVLLPLNLPDDALRQLLGTLAGLVFTGGGDIDPVHYGAPAHPTLAGLDADRDRLEIELTRQITRQGMPFLGICRGIQVINVALGGTLYADIASQYGTSLRHDYQNRPTQLPTYLAHPIRIAEGSRLAGILGEPILQVNSLHHQAVRDLAPGFTPTAFAPDGIIEAIERADYPYGLAVQFHPEWLTDQAPVRALFRSLVEAAAHSNGEKAA